MSCEDGACGGGLGFNRGDQRRLGQGLEVGWNTPLAQVP
jgi:hypothetical protein